MNHVPKYLLFTLLLLAFTSISYASTVTVSPSAMNGWVVAKQSGGDKTASYEFTSGYGTPPAGNGSFHMWVGSAESDPLPKVYLGTNALNGISLNKITQFKLSICPRWNDYKNAQPVTVELAVSAGNNLRLFTFYPWGYEPNGYFGRFQWREFNLMVFNGAWELTNSSSSNYRGDWSWLVSRYPGAKITTPPAKDWPDGTISGTGMNIKIGAGKATDAMREKELKSWWKESCGCNAYVDKLIIGYLNDNGQEVITTYNFEAN